MGKNIEFQRPDGKKASGYLATPASGKKSPGIVVIQEWWGINPQLERTCERWAQAGFAALAPDLYEGKRTSDPNEAGKLMASCNFLEAANQYVRGALQHLKTDGGKAAVSGYCMGGAITVISAVKVPEADVAICFYGIPPEQVAHPKDIAIPFQGHFAEKDQFFTAGQARKLEAALKGTGAPSEVHYYDAQHAFCNEDRPEVYNKEAAALAWERAVGFARQYLA